MVLSFGLGTSIASLTTALGSKASSSSPTLSGTVTFDSANDIAFTSPASTLQATLDSITTAQTTISQALANKAPLASPTLTGTVILPLATNIILTNGTTLTDTLQSKIEFLWNSIDSAVSSIALRAPISNPSFTGNVNLPAATDVLSLGVTLQSKFDLIYTTISTRLIPTDSRSSRAGTIWESVGGALPIECMLIRMLLD